LAPPDWEEWAKLVEAQIVGSTTPDGGISFNMTSKNERRKEHAKAFQHIVEDVLGAENGRTLCEIYGVEENSKDADALQRICLCESDMGFFAAALSIAEGSPDTYFQIFDLPNPFPGPIRDQGAFATHTFDIATLLGGVHEDRLPEEYKSVIARWRDTILDFVIDGTPPCERYIGKAGEDKEALLVGEQGVREVDRTGYMEKDENSRN
jgi:hypothetical protein